MITHAMVEAAWDDALGAVLSGQFSFSDMRAALEAAFESAPTADPYYSVACDETGGVSERSEDPRCFDGSCPGPHRTLIVGPVRS